MRALSCKSHENKSYKVKLAFDFKDRVTFYALVLRFYP
jgi:hypothetical protein